MRVATPHKVFDSSLNLGNHVIVEPQNDFSNLVLFLVSYIVWLSSENEMKYKKQLSVFQLIG